MSKNFTLELKADYDKQVVGGLLLVKRKMALQALKGVTEKMPVETGRARGNTFVSVGYVNDTVTDATDKTGASTEAAGGAVIAGDKDAFAVVFIQNNLPYIERLEDGYSKVKAPQGMFAVTLAELEAQFP